MTITDKRKRGRPRAIFALAVSLSLPEAVVRFLISVPLRRVYELIDRLWKGYSLDSASCPYRQGVRSFIRDVRTYLKGKHY